MTPTRYRRCSPRPRTRRPAAFTLVELLVVIGIIVLLMSILLPAANKVRVQAYSTRTQATMQSVASAIERYYADERAYPGVIRNADITTGTGYAKTNLGGSTKLTMTENMVLAMCGGLTYQTTGSPSFTAADVGKGPINLSESAARRNRRAPYIDVAPGTLLPAGWGTTSAGALNNGIVNGPANPLQMPGVSPGAPNADTRVPEFLDNYSQPRAILYMRAVPSGTVVPDPPTGGTPGDYDDDAKQYNMNHLNPYRRTAAGDFKGDFVFNTSDQNQFKYPFDYLKHPSIANTPRGKDKYILISAGADRRYGTKDDIIVGG